MRQPKEVLLVVRGPLGSNPDALLQGIIATVGVKIDRALEQNLAASQLAPNQWQAVMDGRDVWTGAVRIALPDVKTIQAVHLAMNGATVEAAGDVKAIEVRTPWVDLPQLSQGNGRRAETISAR